MGVDSRTIRTATLVLINLTTVAQVQAVADLSDVPLYVLGGVSPNIVLTIDDSGSMTWAGTPDAIVQGVSDSGVRWRSATYNSMYYNPNIRYVLPLKPDLSSYTTSFTAAYEYGFSTGNGTRNLSSNYVATRSYGPSDSSYSSGCSNTQYTDTRSQCTPTASNDGKADYYVFDATNSGCSGTATDNVCYDRVIVTSSSGPATADIDGDGFINSSDKDERQNFANWYSFYRTRNLAAMSAASLAFSLLDQNKRVAFQNLNKCTAFSTSCPDRLDNDFDNRINTFTGTHRTNFFTWLQRSPANGGTPLLAAAKRAGDMLAGDRAWENTPGSSSSGKYECRANYSILMTDGIWNSGFPSGVGDYDDTGHSLPGTMSYTPASPYQKDNSDTNLADIALKHWAEDLRSDLAASSKLKYTPVTTEETIGSKTFAAFWNPKNDPADWQHVVTFTIGLGLTGTMGSDWGGDTYSGAFSEFADGTKQWPNTGADASGNVWDLWHAAINGRGRFFSAESPSDVVDAFSEILNTIGDMEGSAVSASVSGTQVSADTFVFQASFDTTDWSGDLWAYRMSDGSNDGQYCNNLPSGTLCSGKVWSAANKIDSVNWSSDRSIITNSGGVGVPFRWASISTAQQGALAQADSLGEQRLEFIRGDRSKEGTTFRTRSTVLGDIVNSSPAPLYVGKPSFYYPNDSAYTTFKSTYGNRTKMVYVGSNDGMLHGFDATTGEEKIAFVPNTVYTNLHKLADKTYGHQNYVDGAMISYDLKIGTAYRTYLFGALGLGGKAIYALDVTNPAIFSEGNAANIFKWEFADSNLGYTYGKPRVVRARVGGSVKTVVMFGSGYVNGATAAALYVVDAATGDMLIRVPVPTKIGATTFTDNGIAGITPVDVVGEKAGDSPDGVIDAVYAGDLYGNLWKFDFSGNSPKLAYNSDPMFVALDSKGNRQPITTEPAVRRHPLGNGVLVYFGTGKYLGLSDITTKGVQSFYAIWNKDDTHNTGISRTHLLKQSIIGDNTTKFTSTDARSTTNYPITWHSPSNSTLPGAGSYLGWYLDFDTESGERVHQASFFRGDRVIFVTVTPSDDPCRSGGSSWIYELQALSGSRLADTTPFDYNTDGKFTSADYVPIKTGGETKDQPASAIRFKDSGVNYLDRESVLLDGDKEVKMVVTVEKGVLPVGESSSVGNRRTWRELILE